MRMHDMTTASTTPDRRRSSRLGRLTAVLLLAGAAVAMPQAAGALPPDGPSPNTPGTYAEVWPTTVQAGDVLNFRVSGFPAGEIIHLKYDDGNPDVCGASAVHGACVIHTQVIPSSGVTVGSIIIPSDLPAGNHWLRFLASQPVAGGGVLGFTLHGQGDGYGSSDFTVQAGGTGGHGVSSGGGQPGTAGPAAGAAPGQTTGQAGSADATTGAGATAKAVVGDVPTDEPQRVPKSPVTSGDALPDAKRGDVQAEVSDGNLTLAVSTDYAAEWVFVYAYSTPSELGWQQVANDGTIRFSILDLEAGEHRFAVLDEDGELLGWTEATIDAGVLAEAQERATGIPADLGSDDAGGEIPWIGIGIAVAAVAAGIVVFWAVLRTPKSRRTDEAVPAAAGADSGTQVPGAEDASADPGPTERLVDELFTK